MMFSISILDLINSEAKQKVIRFLLTHDASMSEREIASVAGVSHMSVNRILQDLSSVNLVHYNVVGKAHVWKINAQSYIYRMLKSIVQDVEVLPDPLSELKRVIRDGLPKNLVKQAILFGSIIRKEEKPDSDIDLFLLVANADDKKRLEEAVEALSITCLEVFGNRLAPYIMTEREYQQKKDLKIKDAVERGILVYPDNKKGSA